jgi:hypothetical protein
MRWVIGKEHDMVFDASLPAKVPSTALPLSRPVTGGGDHDA